jgi:hypothetical protein
MSLLFDLDEYKLASGIVSTDKDDKLEALAASVSTLVKSYCARTFVDYFTTDKTEYYNGGNTTYAPEEFPIVSITSAAYSSDYGQTYTPLVVYTDYVLDNSKDVIILFNADTVDSPNAYKLVYKAGYSTVPADLKLALYDLMDYYLKKEATPRKSSGSVSIEYITNSDFPPHIKRILDLYRAIR